MVFAHDTEAALDFAADLVNTATTDPDSLRTLVDLEALLATSSWTGSRTHDEAELESMRDLRDQLRAIWVAEEDDAVSRVNTLLAEARALPQLVKHDGWNYHLHATPPEAPLATRAAVEAAMAFVDVIRLSELDRLHVCEAEDCDDVVLDLSKNRSRRYCEGGCAARAHTAAYRARKAAEAE
ncbi:MAG: CGNR zinc finger domain-containing protein [Dermatophilaceae bacterium]